MSTRILNFAFISISLFLCTACFDINEDIVFKKNGSGTFTFKIDMSQLKSIFGPENGFTKSNSNEKKKPTDKIDTKFNDLKNELTKIDGISNIKQTIDTINIIVSISFDFKNIIALNDGMHIIFKEDNTENKSTKNQLPFFEFKNNQLIRYDNKNTGNFLKAGFEDKNAPKDKNNLTQQLFKADELFKTVSYTTTYQFENEIKETTNENALLSSNLKKIILKCYPFSNDTINHCTLANTVTLK